MPIMQAVNSVPRSCYLFFLMDDIAHLNYLNEIEITIVFILHMAFLTIIFEFVKHFIFYIFIKRRL